MLDPANRMKPHRALSVPPDKQQPPTSPKTEIKVPPDDYQPSKEELEEEVEMPNLTLEETKQRFMRPFKLVPTEPKTRSGTPD